MQEYIKDIELFIRYCQNPQNFQCEHEEKMYLEVSIKLIHILNYIKELESDLYTANSIIDEQIDIIKNSVSKNKIKGDIEYLYKEREKAEKENKIGTAMFLTAEINALEGLLEGDE